MFCAGLTICSRTSSRIAPAFSSWRPLGFGAGCGAGCGGSRGDTGDGGLGRRRPAVADDGVLCGRPDA
eukprot:137896-Chlamydomonas_euryale.AAC.9